MISVAIESSLELLSSVTQPRANTLTVTWSPLPSVPTGLEEHYFYIIEIRKSTNQWSDQDSIRTFQHQAGVTEYNEDISTRLELDTTYAVRLVGKRVQKEQGDREIVSRENRIDIACTGRYMFRQSIQQFWQMRHWAALV